MQWSLTIQQKTRDFIKEICVNPMDGKLHMKNSDGRYGFMTSEDMLAEKFCVIDKDSNESYRFSNIDELLESGWAMD